MIWTATLLSLAGALLGVSGPAAAGAPPKNFDAKDLPVNRWVKLSAKGEAGYTYSQPVYVPSRGRVLHWGAVARGDYRPWFRNDVRAFDAAAGNWASDYPRAKTLPGLLAPPYGKGVFYKGTGEMLECGTPAPSHIVNGVCYDSRRDQVVYTMKGLMAAYDPRTKKWRDMKARTVLYGREQPGGPGVYGVGTCYDPVNDEIVLFPHWGGQNSDLRDVTGRMSAHYGTMIYRFRNNTWRRVGHTFGSEETKRARRDVIGRMGRLSRLLDEVWRLRRRPDPASAAKVGKLLAGLAADVGKLSLPDAAGKRAAKAVPPLRTAAVSAGRGRMAAALRSGSAALRALETVLDEDLRVEPPPRCGTTMVYDPNNKVIVLFGGHDGLVRTDLGPAGHLGGGPGRLNDTWLYDVRTRQWREVPCERRPPVELWPKMVYDPASGLVLLVALRRARGRKETSRAAIWAFDAAKGQWSKLHEQPWLWPIGRASGYGWSNPLYEVSLDVKSGLLILTQNVKAGKTPVGEVFAFRLDAGRMTPTPAPPWQPPPPIKPIEIPPDDPAWLAKLKALPPNKWVHTAPPREAANRGWGMAACDPVRGWVVYFGGGHSTYQVNNVGVYVVGANRWVTAAGDHNDWVPPVGWGGTAMGLRGGPHAHHQRNEYVAIDGRMYRSMGTESRRWGAESAKRPGPRHVWFHDVDRGGVWRQVKIDRVSLGKNVPGTYGRCCVVHPAGRTLGFGGALEPYDGRFFKGEVYFGSYDIYANTLELKTIPPPFPGIIYECRPFCTLPDRDGIFFYECVARKGKVQRRRTWVYDVARNRFTDLKPTRQPPDEPGTVVYLEGQEAIFAAVGRDQQWIYSFKHNTWAPLPLQSDTRFGFDPVYTQLVYVAKYGVLVSVGAASRGTAVMRPDVRGVKWKD